MRIGIVAGEVSGDMLASRLIDAVKQRLPDAQFIGIAGPLMQKAGCETLFPMEKLSVMGLTEVLKQLPEILSIRRQLAREFIANPPDLFIGVDAPDFNISLEYWLRQVGIKTIHYVSPSVWAWRQYRVKKIAKAVDLMLALFPFEVDFYKKFSVPVKFVGHPLADEIPLEVSKSDAREQLGIDRSRPTLAVLPGSRMSEVSRLTDVMLDTAQFCLTQKPDLQFITPFANQKTRRYFESALKERNANLPFQLFDGQSRDVMKAADAILLASGTAALEAMLVNRPMVVTYKVSALSYIWMNAFRTTRFVALPNVLAGEEMVPEIIQNDATAENLGTAVMKMFNSDFAPIQAKFNEIHQQLRCNAAQTAADAVVSFLKGRE